MKRFKREENTIIIHFTFYFVLTFWLLSFMFFSIFQQIKVIENKKIETNNLYNDITRIEKSWLTFDEFKKLNWSWKNNRVIVEILKNMSDEFYTNNLVNTSFATYKLFLEDKVDEINSDENIQIIEEKSKKISKILPWYSENAIDFWNYVLTDYRFINYIESIIETFNFSTRDSIWISKLTILDEFAVNNKDWSSLDSNIYYIPLKLVLKWSKSSIIEFLYFIENVGNINIEDDDIILNEKHWILVKNWLNVVLEWDKYSNNYNIFEHQIADINRISMKEYIDSSYISRWDSDFKEFIINTQWNDDFEISVDLMFYVKGQPTYKIEEFILWVLNKYKELTWLVNIALKNTELKWEERVVVSKYNNTLKLLSRDVLNMRKDLSKKDNLENLYSRVEKLDKVIDPIFKNLKK